MRLPLVVAGVCGLTLTLGCGGGSQDTPAPGTLTLRLGSDSFPGCQQAWVTVGKIEGSGNGSLWTTLGTANQTVDLMNPPAALAVTLLDGVSVPAGTYNWFRITWGSVNSNNPINLPAYVVVASGSWPLTMPTTTTVPATVAVPSRGAATALLMFSGTRAIQQRAATAFTFQATGQAYQAGNFGAITGHLDAGAVNLSGVEVYAETVSGSLLTPAIQRRAFSDANGNYTLQALPTAGGTNYYVVAQPAGTSSAYAAVAAGPVLASLAVPYPMSLNFSTQTPSAAPGSLALTVTPASAATEATWVELSQSGLGSGFPTLIVRSQPLATSGSQDLGTVAGLYPGLYGVTVQRYHAVTGQVTGSALQAPPVVTPGPAVTPVPALTF